MAATAAEQLLIELINRGRLDPGAEAVRMGIDLNAGLDPGTIQDHAMEVLAPNAALHDAAAGHSEWLIANEIFSHDGANGSDAGDRMADAGFAFAGSWAWGENLSWVGNSGTINLNTAITTQYANLFASAGHRENTFDAGFREIGVGQVRGDFRGYDSAMLTENFARAGTTVFVTGVAYDDHDRDGFYDIGEGRGGVSFAAQGGTATSEDAGGYALAVAAGAVEVTVTDGDAQVARLLLDLSQGNAKLDLAGPEDRRILSTSVSTQLLEGLSSARLLGAGDWDLTGLRTANRLWGNAGDNAIAGGGGGDRLWGLAGDDALSGGRGRDRLEGGTGDDLMSGGGGADQFVFAAGNDRVDDFGQGRDRLWLAQGAVGDANLDDVLAGAQVTDAGLVLTLQTGTLTLAGISDAGLLGDRVGLLD